MKMMTRPMARPDIEAVSGGQGGTQIGLGASRRVGDIEAPGQPSSHGAQSPLRWTKNVMELGFETIGNATLICHDEKP